MSRRLVDRVRRKLLQQVLARLLVRRSDDSLVRLGSEYGGWWVPSTVLRPGTTVISAGVGEDTTFDEALLDHGCSVWALDPTPRAQEHVRARSATGAFGEGFHFLPVGLWHRDEVLRFYAPADPAHVSHSVVNAQGTSTWFAAECWSLAHVMDEAGLQSLDLLKMDIEGAEVRVLAALLLGSSVQPSVLCVEFDAPLPEWRTLQLLWAARRANYRLAHAEGWNLVFVRRS